MKKLHTQATRTVHPVTYPVLMKNKHGAIALFTGPGQGIVLVAGGNLPVGYTSDEFVFGSWTLTDDIVTLGNVDE